MSIASQQQRCPKCGGPIPSEAPQGLCPTCLLAEVSIPTEAGYASKSSPPSNEELAAAFPHLEILELIGQGGMGFVFKARQPKLDRFVALKILPQSLGGDPAFAERFSREGRVLARLNHPNIVTIHDFGQANGFFYLLIEFVDGVNLRQAMRAGRFTSDQALAIVPKICEALQFAHNEGILHRDIKPENILLDTRGRVKIADFGISKIIGEAVMAGTEPSSGAENSETQKAEPQLTRAGTSLGTPRYMAPEQREHPDAVDHRADIYSLGVVFYELLTGELPVGKFTPPSEKSATDPRLDSVVRQAMEKERDRRQQSAGEVRTQVETIAASSSLKTEPRQPSRSAYLALTLFLAGTLGTLLLMTVSPRHEMALIFGGTALVLGFIFGVMSWRERLGKGVVIATLALGVGLGITAVVLAGGYLLVEKKEREQVMATRSEDPNRLTQEGWQLWQAQQLDEAATNFTRAILLAPDNPNAWNGLGWASFNSGRTEEAEKAFQKVITLEENHPAALNGLGQIYLSQRKYDLAETYLLKAAPRASAAWYGLARLYLIQGKFEEAEKWAQKVVASGQGDEVARDMLKAAQAQQLDDTLRQKIEPPSAVTASSYATAGTRGLTSTNPPTTDMMRSFATRICEGDDAAFREFRAFAVELYRDLDRATEQDRARSNSFLMRAAFRELGEQAGRSNAHALAALQSAAFVREFKAHVPNALGIAAAAGNEHALDMLLHHQDWNILLSSAVFALGAPAEQNSEPAVDFLIGVLENPKHRALWYGASTGLRVAAANGNAKAKAALEKYKKENPQPPL